ncbi:MAG: hypothetical protein LWX07_00230, partial [Bacteroidetes bacterium]|nr:hypothetical protein [Bacteroidota bacterium]
IEPKKIKKDAINAEISGNELYNKVYMQMIDLFFKSSGIQEKIKMPDDNGVDEGLMMNNLRYMDSLVKEIKERLINDDILPWEENTNLTEAKEERIKLLQEKEPVMLYPKIKKEGIFNDENLTEDYELGYRYHQLGLRMGFFNVKLDPNCESSRISTAEFFPNSFWATVKQRSRWIAGICLQNWKAHKWKGNLTTKYFLFRDRKPIFSLPGAFLSNIIFFYIIYALFTSLLLGRDSVYLVSNSPVMWYLMSANVFFMLSRSVHRFVFTSNWYGFRYGFFSFFRLFPDTAINFFAVSRAIKVFRKTKSKVVWDSTTHY